MTEPGSSPGFLLWHATLRWQRAITAALRPLGLTHVQFVLLASTWWLVDHRGEQVSQRALSDQAGTDPMMTSQVVRALEARALVARGPDPRDSRARLLTVTAEGARLAQEAIEVVEAVDRAFFAAAGGDPSEVLELFRRLAGDPATRR